MGLLEVTDLAVSFGTPDGVVHAVRGLDLSVEEGQTLGIVGESGSGKSVSMLAVLGLAGGQVSGRAVFDGRELISAPRDEVRRLRGAELSMIFQDPLTSLHPLYRVGWQIAEAIRAHRRTSRRAARDRAIELLDRVGIPQPQRRVDDYPHEFSGGMRQRAMIAMALALGPRLLIADEPTTALDVTVQAQIIDLIRDLQAQTGMAVVLITHDLGVIADVADEVLVVYAGKAVERAGRRDLFARFHHPYTRGLLRSLPAAGCRRQSAAVGADPWAAAEPDPPAFRVPVPPALPVRVRPLPARPPAAAAGRRPRVRLLAPRRPARAGCRPGPVGVRGRPPDPTGRAPVGPGPGAGTGGGPMTGAEPLMRLEGVVKHFPVRRGVLRRGEVARVRAVDGVDLDIRRGETLGLVGETGCGKSTLARCLTRMERVTSGRIVFDGEDIASLPARRLRQYRRRVQMVFQDPYGSLNPRRRVGAIIGDPFAIHGTASGEERKRRVRELMELVGLNPEHYNRFPAEFSGGQRQRIGVARALALRPDLVVCDEPVSALDVSIQAQIVNLLADLQSQLGLTYVFIAHDLSVVRHVSDRVAVMYLGRVVEVAGRDDLYTRPRHPYTAALLSAAPVADPETADAKQRVILPGDVPSPINPPSGCRFHPRCPKARVRCLTDDPALVPRLGDPPGHVAACHYPVNDGEDLSQARPEVPGTARAEVRP